MSVVLQISDAHFGTEQAPVIDALLLCAAKLEPDVALFSGDITQRARRSQWNAAHAFAKQVTARQVVAIPGNHDIPLFNVFARMFAPYSGYARAFDRDLERVVDLPDLLLVCVNTTRPHRHTKGEVSAAQLERVSARLRLARREQVRVVVTHQPVHVIRPNDEKNLLRGADAAVRRWNAAGADLFVGGHIHLPYVRPLSDRYAGLRRRGWCVQAGTATSHRVRGSIPNSINVIRHDGSLTCCIERWDFSATQNAFEKVEAFKLEVDRNGEIAAAATGERVSA